MRKARMCPYCKRMLLLTSFANTFPVHFTLTASAWCIGSKKKAS